MEGEMGISATFPTTNTPSAATVPGARNGGPGAQGVAPAQGPERNLQGTSGGSAKAAGAPQIVRTHAEIAFDPVLNRVVGHIVDEETGEEIIAIPPKELKALYTKMREQLGPLVDEKA
jgi:hypothetical protein